MSLSPEVRGDTILIVTYLVVLFSIIEQGWQEVDRTNHAADSHNPYPYSFVFYRQKSDILE